MVCNISYKNLISAKPLHIWFDEVYGFIDICDGTRYLVLFESKKYEFIYSKIKYVTGLKNGITHAISPNFAKIKVD